MYTFILTLLLDFLSKIWLSAYPYGFCNPVWIHGMKINEWMNEWITDMERHLMINLLYSACVDILDWIAVHNSTFLITDLNVNSWTMEFQSMIYLPILMTKTCYRIGLPSLPELTEWRSSWSPWCLVLYCWTSCHIFWKIGMKNMPLLVSFSQ